MTPPASKEDLGLYVHFPYCEKKCPYCDFNSHEIRFDDRRYADAILEELDARAPDFLSGRSGFRTMYFGGGTPSLWDPEQVGRVIETVRRRFALAADAEITLEANPGTVDEGRFRQFVAAGVNRLSIGTQSFVENELVSLGRIHDALASRRAVEAALNTGARVSLDLIYGQPTQSRQAVEASLDAALALRPHHISAYTLTVEPDTVLGRQYAQGRFIPMDDDSVADLIELVTDRLQDAGYLRYEVSSYAPPGQEAVHNTLYWLGASYLGLGAGAHSYRPTESGSIREANIKSPDAYLRDPRQPAFRECLSAAETLADRLLVGFRTRFGMPLAEIASERLDAALSALEAEGLIERSEARALPTARGFFFADRIARTLIDAHRS